MVLPTILEAMPTRPILSPPISFTLFRSPNLLYECGNAGISSRRTIDCLTTLPEHLLVEIKIGVAVVQLHNGE